MKLALAVVVVFVLFGSLVVGFQAVEVMAVGSKMIVVPDDYLTIQGAVDVAVDGDVVFVKRGVYVENPEIRKPITLIGEDRDATIIDVTAGLRIESDNVTVVGFTIYDGWAAISLDANYCNISGNKLTDATYGIRVIGEYNRISGNVFQDIGLSAAIQLSYSNNNVITDNYIDLCTEGIQLREGSSNNIVTSNVIVNCYDVAVRLLGSGIGYTWYDPSSNTITGNNISYSRVGTAVYGANGNNILNNNYFYNKVQFSAEEDYYLSFGYNRSVNTISSNYWSDYNGTDANGDGIGDVPYIIDEYNQDKYPLIDPISLPLPFISTRPNPNNTSAASPSLQPSLSPTTSLNELPYAVGNFTPTPNSTDVALNAVVSISFSRPPSICNLSITPNVAVKERVFESDGFGGTYFFYFAEPLKPQTTYTVTVTYGQETAPEGFKPTTERTWSFTTEAELSTPQLTPSPSAIPYYGVDYTPRLIVIILTVAVVVSVLVYFKKRR